MSRTANIAVYFKDDTKYLHKLVAVTAIDPEGVTEEDVSRAHTEVYKYIKDVNIPLSGPAFVVVKGGKA